MDSSMLEKLLAYAGLGGFCVGILLIIYKETLRAKFLSKLTSDHSFQVVRSIVWLTWSIAFLGLIAWGGLRVLEFYGAKATLGNSEQAAEIANPKLELRKFENRVSNKADSSAAEAKIELDYIEVTGLKNKILEKKINEYIKNQIGVNENYGGTEDLTMIVKNSSLEGDLLSILVEGTYYGHGAGGAANQVRSINLNVKNGEPVEFKDLFRAGYQQAINKAAVSWFAEQPFESSFESVTDNQCYYFDGKYLYLCFSEYEVAPGAEGIVHARLKLENIRGLVSLNGPLAYAY